MTPDLCDKLFRAFEQCHLLAMANHRGLLDAIIDGRHEHILALHRALSASVGMGLDALERIKAYVHATGCGGEWDSVIDKCIYYHQHGWFARVTHALALREWLEGATQPLRVH
jgi:hypothetical protein